MQDLLCLKLSTYLSENHQVAKTTVKIGSKLATAIVLVVLIMPVFSQDGRAKKNIGILSSIKSLEHQLFFVRAL
jgi:hypothetical protein